MSSYSQKQSRRVWKSIGWKSPKFGKRHKPTVPRRWVNAQQNKHKEIHAKDISHYKIRQLKTKKNLENSWVSMTYKEYQCKWQWVSHLKSWKSEGSSIIFFKAKNKRAVRYKFYILWIYPLRMKEKKNILRGRKMKRMC